MRKLAGMTLMAVLAVAPTLAHAESGVLANKKSLSFGIPSGGNGYASGAAGLWMMVTPDINLGMNVGLSFGNKPETSYDVLVAPAIRYYVSKEGSVLPYFAGQLNLRIYDDGVDGNDDDPELSVAGGPGVEWFVTDAFSISGWVGAGLNILQRGGSDAGIRFGTLTSGLTAQLYY